MAKYGVRIKIDVKKIMKAWLFSGAKGTYLDATVFIDPDNQDQYGNNGMITQDIPKSVSEADPQIKGPILGNCKVFWSDSAQQQAPAPQQAPQPVNNMANTAQPNVDKYADFDDDIPF